MKYEGRQCKRCGSHTRYTSSRRCVACKKVHNDARAKKTMTEIK